jgi:hypothetical protein
MPARDLIEAVGTAAPSGAAAGRLACFRIRGGFAYEGIVCPPGAYRLSREEVAAGCAARGVACAAGGGPPPQPTCLCKPCRAADELEIRHAPPPPPAAAAAAGAAAAAAERVCGKMEVCATAQQGAAAALRVVDNRGRPAGALNVTYRLRAPSPLAGAAAPESAGGGGGGGGAAAAAYAFAVATAERGVHVLEVFEGGRQLPNSPVLLAVVERDCGGAGAHRAADARGECACAAGAAAAGGACVPYATLVPAVVVPAAALLVVCGAAYLAHRARQVI